MFDIGGFELLLIAVIGLLVIGPDRLPETLRTLGLWIGRLRRSMASVKAEIEKEIGMDDVRRQLHNEAVMDEMKRIEKDVHRSIQPPSDTPAVSKDSDSSPEPPIAPEPEPVQPRSEAELESLHAMKQHPKDGR